MPPEMPSPSAVSPEALEVARSAASFAAQLEAMSIAARLDLLAYFQHGKSGRRTVGSQQRPSWPLKG